MEKSVLWDIKNSILDTREQMFYNMQHKRRGARRGDHGEQG